MKIAVTTENGQVFPHFGKTPAFTLFEVESGRILSKEFLPTGGNGHGALAGFLREAGAQAVICGGIGPGAVNALSEAGIVVYPGVSGSVDDAAALFLSGAIQPGDGASCHEHEGHHEGHGCGHHGGEGHDCHHHGQDCGHN